MEICSYHLSDLHDIVILPDIDVEEKDNEFDLSLMNPSVAIGKWHTHIN